MSQSPQADALSAELVRLCTERGLEMTGWADLILADDHPLAHPDECGLYEVESQLSGPARVFVFPERIRHALARSGQLTEANLFSQLLITALHEVGHAAFELWTVSAAAGDPIASTPVPLHLQLDEELFAESFAHYVLEPKPTAADAAFWRPFLTEFGRGYRSRFIDP